MFQLINSNNKKTESIMNIKAKLDQIASNLLPAYFALVMATGIVAIAAFIYQFIWFAKLLFYFNIVAYVALWIINIYRIIFHSENYKTDIQNHRRGPGFFTIIAGTNTLGADFLVIGNHTEIAFILWVFGILLWLFYQYVVFASLMFSNQKQPLDQSINGGWLVAIVSTESVALLAAQLSGNHIWMFLIAIIFYLIGYFTYFIIMPLIYYRLLFYNIQPKDVTGSYWINMGATAITTLAGSLILIAGENSQVGQFYPIINTLKSFIQGATFLIWSYGSWWIPLLFMMGYWKHIINKISFKYDSQFWGAVFPMGMYTVATYKLAVTLNIPQLKIISDFFVYVAIVSWLYQFGAFLLAFYNKFFIRTN